VTGDCRLKFAEKFIFDANDVLPEDEIEELRSKGWRER
jgi:hypothetical protein